MHVLFIMSSKIAIWLQAVKMIFYCKSLLHHNNEQQFFHAHLNFVKVTL